MGDQRARYRAKLAAVRSELDTADTSLAALTAARAAMELDHKSHMTALESELKEEQRLRRALRANVLELRRSYESMPSPHGGAVARLAGVLPRTRHFAHPPPAPQMSTIESNASAEAAAASDTPTPSNHVSDVEEDSNSEADDDASAEEPGAFSVFGKFMHRMTHNKELDESSDDEPGRAPVELLASGGAKSVQLGADQ